MQPFSQAEMDFIANIELSLAPNRPLKTYTIHFATGDLIQDNVSIFIKKHNIPLYLELSILSTVGTIYERSAQKLKEERYSNDSGFEIQALKESRRAFIDSYEQHTQEYHSKSAQVQFTSR
jgi:hypothetical protein